MNRSNLVRSTLTVLLAGLFTTACKKDDSSTPVAPTTTRFAATMNGASEKPTSTTSTATGNTQVAFDETTKVFSYTVSYSGLTPTMGHFHRITPNSTTATGGVEIPFTSLTSPITGSFTLASQARIDSFKAGYYYSNLHTVAYPAGEIRGDVKKQ